MAAAQTMIRHREQTVCVRRQIDADDVRFLVHHKVNEAGILVAEAVVVLAPDMRAQQIIQRSNGPAPRNVAGHLEPFRMLIEHGVDDMDKGFVAREKTMASS